jgi:hypothetical protein
MRGEPGGKTLKQIPDWLLLLSVFKKFRSPREIQRFIGPCRRLRAVHGALESNPPQRGPARRNDSALCPGQKKHTMCG